MKELYRPSIEEGYVPEDAGWIKNGEENVLLLSIPGLSSIIHQKVETFDYTWLYQKDMDAYIFCFRLSNGIEKAIIFQQEFAGKMLLKSEAYDVFSVAVIKQSFQDVSDDSEYLYLPAVTISRQSIAGW
ncbi:hypothetical protein LCL95_15370 [Bacillus timonensis]|nr:hypothetical protein [Bacillus timonensis]